jgi:hypothetical protein
LGERGVSCAPTARRKWADWCIAKNRIAEELKEYYRACTTGNYHLNSRFQKSSTKSFSKSQNIAPLPDRRGPIQTQKKTMITKEQLEAIIKAVDAGGDGDDEISEEEVIAILRDHAPGEIPFFQEMFAWERSRNRPH